MNLRTRDRWLDVTQFGAIGDGVADDTAAFRAALAEAGKINGTVFVPDGVYCCGELRIPPHTGLIGNANWGYLTVGGSVLQLNDPAASCLLNMTGAAGPPSTASRSKARSWEKGCMASTPDPLPTKEMAMPCVSNVAT